MSRRPTTATLLGVSLVIHLALIVYADRIDSHPEKYGGLRYTDVDWRVVSDGAKLIFNPTETNQAAGWLSKRLHLPIGE
jgi:phosphatidylinositol glycan class M